MSAVDISSFPLPIAEEGISERIPAPLASFGSAPVSSRLTGSPFNARSIPSITVTRPCPPESTTPASLRTGSISGVFARTSLPYSSICSTKAVISSSVPRSMSALSAIPLATVRIVPSLGFITALYAVSTACVKPAARSSISRTSLPLISLQKPLKSWDRITPELPLAPRRDPPDIAFARRSIVGSERASTSAAAAIMVSVILVPVSPSGTGITFNSFIYSLLLLRLLAPEINAC